MRAAVVCAVALLAAPESALAQSCSGPARPLSPSRDLYCIELIPAPGITAASGHVTLQRKPSAFTIDVTASGELRWSPRLTLANLPAPSLLGAYTTYVAWAVPPMMHPFTRLAAVRNGATPLPTITLDKFIVLVTAEASADVSEPTGRLVLRGASPSTRLQPPDLMQFALGATRDTSAAHATHARHENASGDTTHAPARWTSVPMPDGLTMLPAEMALRPRVGAYLPRSTGDIADAVPRTAVQLKTGDTLRLTAGLVRRVFKGRAVTMFGFNGQYPGPLLVVPQAAEVVVIFSNALDQPTTVHWHGLRLDNAFDGVPDLTQDPVQPGERFVYRLRFPDAGIYWYHPHVREDVQQDLGLYGNMLVRPSAPEHYSAAHREEVLILDDLLVGDDGLVPFGADQATHALMGRFGNVMLVNGEPRHSMSVRRGDVVRVFLTNVSNTRTFNVSWPGVRMKVVASDVGNFEREEWIESVVIGPAERYVVHARFDSAGMVPTLNRVQGLDHLAGRFFYETDTLGVVMVDAATASPDLSRSFDSLRLDRAAASEIARYRGHFVRDPDKSLVLSIQPGDLPFFTRQIMQLDSIYFTPVEWSGTMPGMNWASTSDQLRWVLRDPGTGRENMDIDWTFRRGAVIKLRLSNERRSFHAMQHTIHLHGQRFLVVAVNDVRNTNLAWKDTILLPVGFTADILVDLSNPGRWMLHCHIAEHLTAHMMMAFTVR